MRIDLGLDVPIRLFDFETYPNITTCAVRTIGAGDRMFSTRPGIGEPLAALRDLVRSEPSLWVGFNNVGFDNHVMKAIVQDGIEDAATLKRIADERISGRRGGNGGPRMQQLDFGGGEVTADMFAMFKGPFGKIGGLKMVAFKLDAPKHSELPFPPDQDVADDDLPTLLNYNVMDLDHTERMLAAVQEMLKIRLALAERYNLDISTLINASDSRLAEEVVKVGMAFPGDKPTYPRATSWAISGAEIVDGFEFYDKELIAMRDRIAQQMLTYTARKVTKKDGDEERKVTRPFFRERFTFGGLTFKLGMGGLHSIDKPGVWEADDEWAIWDFDIASYYPMMLRNNRWAPGHLDQTRFTATLTSVIEQRLAAKKSGDTLLASALKVAVNSVFGKTKSAYSWLLDPTVTAKICITGEMIILQAVELMASLDDVEVLMVNTDGLLLRCRRSAVETVQETMQAFAAIYNMECEGTEYRKLFRRDGNNYLALPVSGPPKAKGDYGYARSDLEKKPTERIIADAVQAFFIDKVPVEQTIAACDDIREFVDYAQAGGGYRLEDEAGRGIGKMARWYRATGDEATTLYRRKPDETSRTKIAGGVALAGDLPSTIPDNLDRPAFCAEAEKRISAILAPKEKKASMQVAMEDLSEEQRQKFQDNAACEIANGVRCNLIDLHKYARMYENRAKGNRYDTMRFMAWCLWVDQKGRLTRGDMNELMGRLLNGDDYWESAEMQDKIEATVENLAFGVSPFPKPQSTEEIIAAAMTWARERVEVAKRRRKMYHVSLFESTYITATSINNYLRNQDEMRLARALCAAFVKYSLEPDLSFITSIIDEVKALGGQSI